MYEVGQTLYHTVKYLPITSHTITDKLVIEDADGKKQTVYFLSGYAVYFPEKELIEDFSIASRPSSEPEGE